MIVTLSIEQLERFYEKLHQKGKGGGTTFVQAAAPTPPDPVATANAQGAANKEAAIASQELSMVNQVSPYGNLDFDQTRTSAEGTPQYTATSTLTPSGQRQLDLTNQAGERFGETANAQLNQVSGQLSEPVNFAGLGQAPTADLSTLGQAPTANFNNLGAAPVANEQTRQTVRQAIQDREQPFQDRRLDQLTTRLDTQGIAEGSKAYSRAMDDFNRGVNDFNLGADRDALGQMQGLYGIEADQRGRATNEIGQQFDFANQARDRGLRNIEAQYGLDANARDRAVNELVQQRQIPLNELAAMLSGSQVQGPSFLNTPSQSIQAGDIQGATYANYTGAQNAYNQAMNRQQQSNSSAKGGMGSTLGALAQAGATAYASDRRLKENIRKIGQLANGLFVYLFNYKWNKEEQIGVMSDEVRAIMPHAVVVMPNGYDAVIYDEVLA
jgi:hypothetical protein